MTALTTRLVHPPDARGAEGEVPRPSSTPIYQTATFAIDPQAPGSGWDYTRSGNPTRDVLEAQLAALDGAARSLAYGSGMAAVAAVLRLARQGQEVVVGEDLYGGTSRFLAQLEDRWGIAVRRVDTRDLEAVARALSPRTALVFVETPTNPRLRTVDIPALAKLLARASPRATPRPLLAVDNSMLSPYWQRPLEEGADLALQSATKLLGGHGDLTAGVVSVRDPQLGEELAFLQNAEGTALAPFEAWLLLRGLETLPVRLDRQRTTTHRLVDFLRGHPAVQRAYYPEPPAAGGVVVSFETGSVEVSRRLLAALRYFRVTVSFGSVTSSISLPWEMSHASMPEAERRASGLAPDLVRLSVGLEDGDDLQLDLEMALAGIRRTARPAARCAASPGSPPAGSPGSHPDPWL